MNIIKRYGKWVNEIEWLLHKLLKQPLYFYA